MAEDDDGELEETGEQAPEATESIDEAGEIEEVEESEEADSLSQPVPAENVDLKEVVSDPIVPTAQKSEPEVEPTETPTIEETIDKASVFEDAVTETPEPIDPPLPEATPDIDAKEPGLLKKIASELVGDDPQNQQEPLVLLNSEVAPGTSTRLGWSPSVSFMGISTPTAVLVLNGVKRGPTLCLTAAVHGDELNGIEIVRRILYNIDPEELSGAVIGVPIVNVQGFRRSSRYLPDRRDLNRFFPGNPQGSSASRIAYSFFSEVISNCDMLIDLHTGSFRRTNLPQLRANLSYPDVADLAKKMGSIVVVHSEGAQGSLRRAAVENGIPSVTLEAGAPHELQKAAVEHGVKSIENAMDSLKMIQRRRFWERMAEPVYYQSTWVRSMEGGILFSEIPLGANVRKGDLLGTVTDPITNVRSEITAPFDGRVIGMALNQVMFPGFAAYHIGLKASVEEAAQTNPIVGENSVPPEAEAVEEVAEKPAAAVLDQTPPADDASQGDEDVIDAEIGLTPIEDSE